MRLPAIQTAPRELVQLAQANPKLPGVPIEVPPLRPRLVPVPPRLPTPPSAPTPPNRVLGSRWGWVLGIISTLVGVILYNSRAKRNTASTQGDATEVGGFVNEAGGHALDADAMANGIRRRHEGNPRRTAPENLSVRRYALREDGSGPTPLNPNIDPLATEKYYIRSSVYYFVRSGLGFDELTSRRVAWGIVNSMQEAGNVADGVWGAIPTNLVNKEAAKILVAEVEAHSGINEEQLRAAMERYPQLLPQPIPQLLAPALIYLRDNPYDLRGAVTRVVQSVHPREIEGNMISFDDIAHALIRNLNMPPLPEIPAPEQGINLEHVYNFVQRFALDADGLEFGQGTDEDRQTAQMIAQAVAQAWKKPGDVRRALRAALATESAPIGETSGLLKKLKEMRSFDEKSLRGALLESNLFTPEQAQLLISALIWLRNYPRDIRGAMRQVATDYFSLLAPSQIADVMSRYDELAYEYQEVYGEPD